MERGFFDLETLKLFSDFPRLSRNQAISKLGMSTACVIGDGKNPTVKTFDEGEEIALIKHLSKFDTVIGFNIGFDYGVLSPHYGGDMTADFSPKTVDLFEKIRGTTG